MKKNHGESFPLERLGGASVLDGRRRLLLHAFSGGDLDARWKEGRRQKTPIDAAGDWVLLAPGAGLIIYR